MVFNAEQNMRAVRAQHEAQLQAMRAEVFQPAALQAPAVLALQVAAILCTKQSHPIPIALSSAPRHTFRPGCSTLVHSNLLYSTQLYSTLAYMYSTQFYSTQHVLYYTLCPTILYSKPYSFLLSYSPLLSSTPLIIAYTIHYAGHCNQRHPRGHRRRNGDRPTHHSHRHTHCRSAGSNVGITI